ncbi:MAG: phosphoribosyltransferase family protein [Candidatus Parvarchaeum sp.]
MITIPVDYEYTWYRSIKCKICSDWLPIFGLGHYKSEVDGGDSFSKRVLWVYKYGNDDDILYFSKRLYSMYKEWFEPDNFLFDIICVIPSHKKGEINKNLECLAKGLGEKIGVRYSPILFRNRDVLEQHNINNVEERLENVKASIDVTEDVKNKSVLVLDNLTTTGANIIVTHEALKNAEVKEVIFVCLGFSGKYGNNIDFDLNPSLKYRARGVIKNFHANKLSKEERQKHRENLN